MNNALQVLESDRYVISSVVQDIIIPLREFSTSFG